MAQQVHIEVQQKPSSCASRDAIVEAIETMVELHSACTKSGTLIKKFDDHFLKEHVKSILVSDVNDVIDPNTMTGDFPKIEFIFYVYKLDSFGQQIEALENEEDGQEVNVSTHWLMPSAEFDGLWESLVYDSELKNNLLSFVETTLLFSDKCVDSNLVSWNRVVLLHGPPGTGKTSLCKALAQKVSIRFRDRFSQCELVEINSHSLFSRWFSESGKLVMKMFSKIQEILQNSRMLVFVLIDEVESLAHARQSSLKGLEPSDSIRAVNALLTQIDRIKRHPNVLILTTSNITNGIDLAFVDRADIKQYIGFPTVHAIYDIFLSSIKELQKSGIIHTHEKFANFQLLELSNFEHNESLNHSLVLLKIAELCKDYSGRTLRKLPFLAHAYSLQKSSISLEVFLEALKRAVLKHKSDVQSLNSTDE